MPEDKRIGEWVEKYLRALEEIERKDEEEEEEKRDRPTQDE